MIMISKSLFQGRVSLCLGLLRSLVCLEPTNGNITLAYLGALGSLYYSNNRGFPPNSQEGIEFGGLVVLFKTAKLKSAIITILPNLSPFMT